MYRLVINFHSQSGSLRIDVVQLHLASAYLARVAASSEAVKASKTPMAHK